MHIPEFRRAGGWTARWVDKQTDRYTGGPTDREIAGQTDGRKYILYGFGEVSLGTLQTPSQKLYTLCKGIKNSLRCNIPHSVLWYALLTFSFCLTLNKLDLYFIPSRNRIEENLLHIKD